MSGDEFAFLLAASDDEWADFIGCSHPGETYQEPGPLTGVTHTRCSQCHSVVAAGE